MSYTVLQARAVSTHIPIIYSLQEKKRKERMDLSAQEKSTSFAQLLASLALMSYYSLRKISINYKRNFQVFSMGVFHWAHVPWSPHTILQHKQKDNDNKKGR